MAFIVDAEDLQSLALEVGQFVRSFIAANPGRSCLQCGITTKSSEQYRMHLFSHNQKLLDKIMKVCKSCTVSESGTKHMCLLCNKPINNSSFKLKDHFIYKHLVDKDRDFAPHEFIQTTSVEPFQLKQEPS